MANDPNHDDLQSPEEAETLAQSEAMLARQESDSPSILTGASDPMLNTVVGRYRIKRVIGEGGMGTVYEALQESPRRTVALKMVKHSIHSPNLLRRFEYESQTLGRLKHPNIAQIYEAGTHDVGHGPRPYFVMEYLVGAKPITEYAREKKLNTRDRLSLFTDVCDAMQHGHQKGIIHRDLKPANILVTSSGIPKVIDFGVARSTDSDLAVTTLQTDVGVLIGTLQYMSPEQCAGDPHDIDTRSDVYALGVILFELLCDSLPYNLKQAAIHEAVKMVQELEPAKLSSINRRLRGDVETITMKALEKDRLRRYQSASEFEEDINRYLRGDPISARPASMIYQLRRIANKHKGYTLVATAILLTLLIGGIVSTLGWKEAEAQKQIAITERDEVEARNDILDSSVNQMLSGIMRQVRYLGNSADAQRALLDLARSNVTSLAARGDTSPLRQAQLAQAWLRIAKSHLNTSGVGYGSLDEADLALVEATRILGEIDSTKIKEKQLRSGIEAMQLDLPKIAAEAQRSRAETTTEETVRFNALRKAADLYRQRIALGRDRVASGQHDIKSLDVQYSSHMGLGHVLLDLQDEQGAQDAYLAALSLSDRLRSIDIDKRERRLRDHAIALHAIATIQWKTSPIAAREKLDEAIENIRAIIAIDKTNVRRPRDLATMLALRGKLRATKENDIDGSIDDYRESVELFTGRAVESPREPTAQDDFETTVLDMMTVLSAASKGQAATDIKATALTQLHCVGQAEFRAGHTQWIDILANLAE